LCAEFINYRKKLKVMGDWTADLLFKPDVARVRNYIIKKKEGHYKADLDHGMKKETKKENTSNSVNIRKDNT
jgi:hypothetical protein